MKKNVFMLFFPVISALIFADVTYWLHSDAYNHPEVKAAIEEAVPIYNKYGSFNKHLSVYYNPGIPTAEANYDGYIGFGGSRNTRVALHEMGHTMGVGTYWQYGNLMVGGVWQGFYGRKLAIEMGGYTDGLHGDGTHIWPWGLNYDNEDGFMERIKHVRIMAAIRCDMGIMAYSKEAEHRVVPLGGTAVFGVSSPIATSYQWYKNGVALSNGGDISGANRSTLQIANVDLSDEGSYYCAAIGAGETLNSRARRLILQKHVGQWDFNGNANDSVGSNHGTTFGSPAYAAGKVGQAIVLDGTDDYVMLPVGVADAEDITVAAWVYWNGGNQWQRIFDFGTSTSQNLFLTPRSGSNTLRFAIKNGGGEQIIETAQLTVGQWVHLAVTLRQDTATLYVNGRPVAASGSVTIDPAVFSPDRNYIGKSQWPDPLFNGRIDDFRIYNYALAGSDIWNLWGQSADNPPVFAADPLILPDGNATTAYTGQTLANYAGDSDDDLLTFSKVSGPAWLNVAANGTLSGTPGTADRGENTFVVRVTDLSGATDDAIIHIVVFGAPDAHYRFEGTANDSAGSNHGTATGSPVYTTGILGQAVDLDGTDDYITLPAGIVNTADITIAAWVNWDGGGNWQRIFDFGNNTTQYMFLTPQTDGMMRFVITASGNGAREERLETTGLTIGQWVHVAVTLNGDTGKLYVNGVLKDLNTAMTIDPLDFNPTINYIGKSQWPDPLFNGRIDDFRIYRYALSATEIAALSLPPSFIADPISNADATELEWYIGQSLTTYIDAPQGTDGLTFSKDTGPGWLAVASDGTLSGIPNDSHVGENIFMVRVENTAGVYDTAAMTINVANVYSGVRGMEDLAGLATQWLLADCTDTPACGGADLDGDLDVTISDFSVLAHNWLADEALHLHLALDETSGDMANDSSIYWRSGQLVNDPVWSSGYTGGALSFDGTDDYVEIPGYKGITGTSGRTCMAWIQTAGTQQGTIISWGTEQAGQKWMFRIESNGTLGVGVWNGYINSAAAIDDGQWRHVAAVLNDDGNPNVSEILLYIDGVLQSASASNTQAINTTARQNVLIGTSENAGVNGTYFNGRIDEVRIYDRPLSEAEIQELAMQ